MSEWTCPDCHRQFRRRGQTHVCAPGMSLEKYFVKSMHGPVRSGYFVDLSDDQDIDDDIRDWLTESYFAAE